MSWPGRLAAAERRIETMERAAAAAAESAAARDAGMTQALRDISTRLLAIETRAAADARTLHDAREAIAALTARTAPVAALAEQATALATEGARLAGAIDGLRGGLAERDAEVARLRAAITWLEHQARAQAEEMRGSVAALIEHVSIRRASGPAD